jgi:hypothetical protein
MPCVREDIVFGHAFRAVSKYKYIGQNAVFGYSYTLLLVTLLRGRGIGIPKMLPGPKPK